jgi:hypothetical protein
LEDVVVPPSPAQRKHIFAASALVLLAVVQAFAVHCVVSMHDKEPDLRANRSHPRPLPNPSIGHSRFRGIVRARFEIVDDFLSENVRIWKIVGVFEAFVSEPEELQAS